jgi:hypothetical protein
VMPHRIISRTKGRSKRRRGGSIISGAGRAVVMATRVTPDRPTVVAQAMWEKTPRTLDVGYFPTQVWPG